jgi:hypothetical protein
MELVLEKMFFIQCLGEPLEFVPGPEVVAYLTFEGDPSGALTLRMTAGAARSVAADFLGAEEFDLSDQQVGDVVSELANMICGSVLSRAESFTSFTLASPRIVPSESEAGRTPAPAGAPPFDAGARNSTTHAVMIGSGRMVVSIDTETPAWSAAAKSAF